MPHYHRFKDQKPVPKKKNNNSRYYYYARSTSYYNTHRMRAASKQTRVNPLVVKLSIIILVFAILFGFIKSGASSFNRIVKIGGKNKDNLSSIDTAANTKSETSDEESMSLLKSLSFKIFAKPEGDDSVIHEVSSDEGTEDEDYISTVIRRTSLDNIENSYMNNTDDDNENNAFDNTSFRELFGGSENLQTNNSDSSQQNNAIANTTNNAIDNTSANSNLSENTSLTTISENIIASVLNQSNIANDNRTSVSENESSNATQQQSNATQQNNQAIETKKFDEILSPREESTQASSQTFVPARTPNSPIDTENSSKEYQEENMVLTDSDRNKIINNNLNYNIESVETTVVTTTPQRPNINTTSSDNNTTTQTPSRTDIVELNEISEIIDNINNDLPNTTTSPSSQGRHEQRVESVNNNSQSSSGSNETRDNSWNINIEREGSSSTGSSNILRGEKTQPAIFLAQYDDRRGSITIIPQERNMSRNTTLEEAILMLLEGAKEEEYRNNIISLISKNTSLLDLFVSDDTVFLNFSEDFEYNPLGDEGIVVQIYQIVYTATQFEGIDKVIFLINGEQKEFIGSEGLILNKEFSRMEVDSITQ